MRLATVQDADGWIAAVVVDDWALVDGVAAAREASLQGPETCASVKGIVGLERDALDRLQDGAERLAEVGGAAVRRIEDARLGPPVPDPEKILCIGLNYRAHAAEAALAETGVPTVFAKFANSLIGDNAPIEIRDPYADAVDYEAELAVVIGRRLRFADEAQALEGVAGWMPFNDVSARDLQTQTSQWTAGKAVDGFAPCGPFLVVDDSLRNGGLEIETRVNGERRQHDSTKSMIFGVPALVAFISSFLTLEPGDVIATGTPEGVGMHRDPPLYLRDGDLVEVAVGNERLRNRVRAVT